MPVALLVGLGRTPFGGTTLKFEGIAPAPEAVQATLDALRAAMRELLNQMEGLAEDADLLFLLTSNRPDVLEPALAARPGRVDLSLEIPLPDAAARERLLRLYADGIEFDVAEAVARTEHVSGAFIKELMRQAALRGALEDRDPSAADVAATLDDLLSDRSALTKRLLGDGTAPEMTRALEAAGLDYLEIN